MELLLCTEPPLSSMRPIIDTDALPSFHRVAALRVPSCARGLYTDRKYDVCLPGFVKEKKRKMDQTFDFRELLKRYRHPGQGSDGTELKTAYDRPRYSPSPFIMQASDMVIQIEHSFILLASSIVLCLLVETIN